MTRILGQSRALEILGTALRSKRFHHGWIFSGPRGVGKFTTAVEVARVLLDPDMPRDFSCDIATQSSPSHIQTLLSAGSHPDLHIIRKELARFSENRDLREKKQTNIPLDLLRERVIGGKSGETYHEAAAYRTAVMNHGKVFIIDEAELLDSTGQNAMLKTLEEPPSDTYFFLITSEPDRLLPTIRSRCQHVRFGRLDEQSMREWLEIAKQGQLDATGSRQREGKSPKDKDNAPPTLASLGPKDAAMLSWALQFAEGSPGVALLAIEYDFYRWQQTLDPMLAELERGRFPVGMGETLAGLVEEFAVTWVKHHGEKTTSKDAANKDGAGHLLTLLSSHARRRMAECCERGQDPTSWIHAIELIREAERQIDSNVNQKLALENLVVQWANTAMSAAA